MGEEGVGANLLKPRGIGIKRSQKECKRMGREGEWGSTWETTIA